jgi:hypothetical protein
MYAQQNNSGAFTTLLPVQFQLANAKIWCPLTFYLCIYISFVLYFAALSAGRVIRSRLIGRLVGGELDLMWREEVEN